MIGGITAWTPDRRTVWTLDIRTAWTSRSRTYWTSGNRRTITSSSQSVKLVRLFFSRPETQRKIFWIGEQGYFSKF